MLSERGATHSMAEQPEEPMAWMFKQTEQELTHNWMLTKHSISESELRIGHAHAHALASAGYWEHHECSTAATAPCCTHSVSLLNRLGLLMSLLLVTY